METVILQNSFWIAFRMYEQNALLSTKSGGSFLRLQAQDSEKNHKRDFLVLSTQKSPRTVGSCKKNKNKVSHKVFEEKYDV